jgi:hypothetical protein
LVTQVAGWCHQHSESASVQYPAVAFVGSQWLPVVLQNVFTPGICSQLFPPW